MREKKLIHFYDTSALLNISPLPQTKFYVSSIVLGELEHIKESLHKDEATKAKTRKVIKFLRDNENAETQYFGIEQLERIRQKYPFLSDKNDSKLICEALILARKAQVIFYTSDVSLYNIVRTMFPALNANFVDSVVKEKLWEGYKEVEITDADFDSVSNITTNHKNIFNCLTNEYVIMKQDDKVIGVVRWDGNCYQELKYENLRSRTMKETIKPKDIYQKIAFDMLQNKDIKIKILFGDRGTGKNYITIAHALEAVERGQYDKIIVIRNNIEVKNTRELGHLPGSLTDKLMSYLMPFADQLPYGEDDLLQKIEEGIIEPVHLGFLRGRSFRNSLIICDEAANLTKEHIQLLIGRIGENSELIVIGDLKQKDSHIFEVNNGMEAMNRKLKGRELFAAVNLRKIIRSAASQYADILDLE